MPSVIEYNTEQWEAGPQTPASRLFRTYVSNVDSAAYQQQAQDQYYSQAVVFHNCNGSAYYGAGEIRQWLKDIFAPFERVSHTIDSVQEIDRGDGSYQLNIRGWRNLWVAGCDRDGSVPDVAAPLFMTNIICPEPGLQGSREDRLRIREVWLYWDTSPLHKFLDDDAVVFSEYNIYQTEWRARRDLLPAKL